MNSKVNFITFQSKKKERDIEKEKSSPKSTCESSRRSTSSKIRME